LPRKKKEGIDGVKPRRGPEKIMKRGPSLECSEGTICQNYLKKGELLYLSAITSGRNKSYAFIGSYSLTLGTGG